MLKKLSDFLSSKASLFIILTAVVTFFYPQLFAWVKGDTQTIILGVVLCAISCAWHSISGTILANIFAHQQTNGVQNT